MSHPSRTVYAQDWYIVRKERANIGAILGIGFEEYIFKSTALRYKTTFYLPKVSVGATIGAEITGGVEQAVSAINSNLADNLRAGNETWRIRRRFSLNTLVGGSVRIGSVGATTGPVGGEGNKLVIYDNDGTDVASYEGGSFGAAAGAEINLGNVAIGLLLGPYSEC